MRSLLAVRVDGWVGRYSLNSLSNVNKNRYFRNASCTGRMSICGSISVGPIQYLELSPQGSFTTHDRPRNVKENRSSLNQIRRTSVTPSTDFRTRHMGPSDQGKLFDISKAPIVPSSRASG